MIISSKKLDRFIRQHSYTIHYNPGAGSGNYFGFAGHIRDKLGIPGPNLIKLLGAYLGA